MIAQVQPSCPDLIRASINLRKNIFGSRWICRVGPAMTRMNSLPLHKLRKGRGIIRMPARQGGAVFDDVSGGPENAPLVEAARHVVVRAQDIEIPGVDVLNHEVDGLLGGPGAGGLFGAAARGQAGEDMAGDQE